MVQNTRILFQKRPSGEFNPLETFEIEKVELNSEKNEKDNVLVKVLYLSLDPAMRGWMNDVRSYIEPLKIGQVMRAYGLAQVTQSNSNVFQKGDIVSGMFGWQTYVVMNAKELKLVGLPEGTPKTTALSLFSLTGLTAYFGLLDIGKPKPGETVVISGAAGATGSTAGQIAKILGCRVIGIAGSDDKCRWLTEELGFDVALNYKNSDFNKKFVEATPKFVDVYFDNVGGSILDLCLSRLAFKGRIVVCGAISQYNTKTPKGPANYMTLITMRGKMEGFIVTDYQSEFPQAIQKMVQWYSQGKLKMKDTIIEGLENAPNALSKLFQGVNTGKLLIKVAEEEELPKSNL